MEAWTIWLKDVVNVPSQQSQRCLSRGSGGVRSGDDYSSVIHNSGVRSGAGGSGLGSSSVVCSGDDYSSVIHNSSVRSGGGGSSVVSGRDGGRSGVCSGDGSSVVRSGDDNGGVVSSGLGTSSVVSLDVPSASGIMVNTRIMGARWLGGTLVARLRAALPHRL